MIKLALAPCLALAMCQTVPEPQIITKEVRVPVAVSCVTQSPAKPNYPDTNEALAAAPDIFEAVKLLLAGRELSRPYEAEMEAVIGGCVAATPAP